MVRLSAATTPILSLQPKQNTYCLSSGAPKGCRATPSHYRHTRRPDGTNAHPRCSPHGRGLGSKEHPSTSSSCSTKRICSSTGTVLAAAPPCSSSFWGVCRNVQPGCGVLRHIQMCLSSARHRARHRQTAHQLLFQAVLFLLCIPKHRRTLLLPA